MQAKLNCNIRGKKHHSDELVYVITDMRYGLFKQDVNKVYYIRHGFRNEVDPREVKFSPRFFFCLNYVAELF